MHAQRSVSKKCKLLFVVACLILLAAASTNILADWDQGDSYKMHFPQEPDPIGWDICLHEQFVADDFQCTESGPIRDIHFWVSWQQDIDEFPLTQFTVQIRQNLLGGPCGGGRPGSVLWTWSSTGGIGKFTVRQPPYQGQQGWHCPSTGLTQNPDHLLYWQINITDIPEAEAYHQTAGQVYWLVIRANKAQWPPAVGWKTSLNRFMSCSLWSVNGILWSPVTPDGTVDQAFVITNTGGQPDLFDFGDAPEAALAYPASGAMGMFPTCVTVGPANWIQHSNFGAYFGPAFDLEPDGNAGLCPGFAPYDADECFQDGDAGLLIPTSNTIMAGTVVPCPGSVGPTPLGKTCQPAAWGANIDVDVHNHMPSQATGYVNVLIDWDQNGAWGGASYCTGIGSVPEQVLVDFPVPNPYDGPLSGLLPPSFIIGPNAGYVWTRISITEVPVGPNWDGSGIFEDGETEDYLLQVDPYQPPEELDWGDAPDPTYPTLAASMGANHIIRGPWLGDALDTPDPDQDGQPTPIADGDDLMDGNDDEDGVQVPLLTEGLTGFLAVTVSDPAGLGGIVELWIDWNQDGAWAHPGEQVYAGFLPVGVNPVAVTPPTGSAGQTFLRARISSQGGLMPSGSALSGEVEDHLIMIEEAERLDFGDAPDSPQVPGYPTLLVNNGARHIISGPWLGDGSDAPDAEADGQPTGAADGDDVNGTDDEDGVSIPVMTQGMPATLQWQVSGGGGVVESWFDWNQNSIWEPAEQVHNAFFPDGPYTTSVTVPSSALAGRTYARFRISSTGVGQPTGAASDGEVEDYLVMIEPGPGSDLGDAPDSTNAGGSIMSAYPGVQANYPTVFNGPVPIGPKHIAPLGGAWLGQGVSLEDEADSGLDTDLVNNIDPVNDVNDLDGSDDALTLPLQMPGCKWTKLNYQVNVPGAASGACYVNIWCDWNRDGDWNDLVNCTSGAIPEWAVRNQMLTGLLPGLNNVTSLPFVSWHPSTGSTALWLRITLSEQPWQEAWGDGGCGPVNGYALGETEDYLVVPDTSCVECADLNCDNFVDLEDFAILASQWLSTCP